MIMKDTIRGAEVVALVADPDLVGTFLIAPRLTEACEHLLALRPVIEKWSRLAGVEKAERDAILLALAAIQVELQEKEREESR